MASRRRAADPLEASFAELRTAREDPHAESSLAALRRALAHKSAHVAQRAAEIARDFELHVLEPDLVAAFPRFLVDLPRNDAGCVAKTAIVEALAHLGSEAPEVYLAGVRHVQKEPSFGPPVDTAAGLRGACGMGLVRIAHREAYELVAELLADPEERTRTVAAEAVGYGGSELGAPLLRLKVLVGDREPRVLGACFASLLQIAPLQSLPFVARFLEAPADEVRELAALALGESQRSEALPLLVAFAERARAPEALRAGLLAISFLRSEAALDHLVGLVAEAPTRVAREALHALRIHRERAGFGDRLRAAAAAREADDVRDALREALEG